MDYEYEYDYEDEPRYGRVLWGRIGLLVIALALVFLLGRCTAGGGVDEDELEALAAERDALQEELADTQAELEAAEAGGIDDADPEPADDEPEADDEGNGNGDAAEDDDAAADDGNDGVREHEVQASETLYTIAEQYYGDGSQFTLITEANNLSRDDPLRVGQVLEIPPED